MDVETLAKIAQTVGVLIAGLGLLFTAEVRRRDLKWRKALESQRMLDQIHSHALAREALHVMDCALGGFKYEFRDPAGVPSHHGLDALLKDITKGPGATSPGKQLYACFDWFFYYTDRIGYMVIEAKLLNINDFASIYKPYADLLLDEDRWSNIEKTIEAHNYEYVKQFFEAVRSASQGRLRHIGAAARLRR